MYATVSVYIQKQNKTQRRRRTSTTQARHIYEQELASTGKREECWRRGRARARAAKSSVRNAGALLAIGTRLHTYGLCTESIESERKRERERWTVGDSEWRGAEPGLREEAEGGCFPSRMHLTTGFTAAAGHQHTHKARERAGSLSPRIVMCACI